MMTFKRYYHRICPKPQISVSVSDEISIIAGLLCAELLSHVGATELPNTVLVRITVGACPGQVVATKIELSKKNLPILYMVATLLSRSTDP